MDYKLGYLLADFICSEKQTVFRECKTVSYEKRTMSKDKYSSIFLCKMESIMFIILQMCFATRPNLKFGEYPRKFPASRWGILGNVTHSH